MFNLDYSYTWNSKWYIFRIIYAFNFSKNSFFSKYFRGLPYHCGNRIIYSVKHAYKQSAREGQFCFVTSVILYIRQVYTMLLGRGEWFSIHYKRVRYNRVLLFVYFPVKVTCCIQCSYMFISGLKWVNCGFLKVNNLDFFTFLNTLLKETT